MYIARSPKLKIMFMETSSAIRQKGESQNGFSRKQSTSNFLKNEHFLPPDTLTYVRVSGGQKYSLFGKFDVLFS